ncbi:MAG: hypothetical protein U0791_00065 [Gemmataceae bacterium]
MPVAEVPITSITSGVHTQTWLSPRFRQLYDRYLGVHWDGSTDFSIWKRVEHIQTKSCSARTPPRAVGGVRTEEAAESPVEAA